MKLLQILISYLFVFKKIEMPTQINPLELQKIIEINEKYKLLQYLTSNHTSIHNKLNALQQTNTPKPINYSSGGLFNDWNL